MNRGKVPSFIYGQLIEPVINFVLPALCVHCKSPLTAGRKIICPVCYQSIKPLNTHFLESLIDEITIPHFDNCYVVFQFDEVFQRLIHLFKYQRYKSLANYFAESLAEHIENHSYDFVTGVPLNPIRERERGYNQANLIARAFAQKKGYHFAPNLLLRNKNTVSQTTLNRLERMQNMHRAFKAEKIVKDKKILITDDVITTGSTLNECALELKKQGVALVDIAAMATPVDILQNRLELAKTDSILFD